MPNFERSRLVWRDHLLRWGGDSALSAKAVKNGVTRPMVMAMSSWSPRERASLALEGAVRIIVSAYQVAVNDWIDWETDLLWFNGVEYKIGIEPLAPRPDGRPIAWDCACVRLREVTEEELS